MKVSKDGIALIKKREQCRLTAYKATPAEKYYTIGWGHYGADVKPGMVITQEQADQLFEADSLWVEAAVNEHCPTATQGQHDALASLCYNIGEAQFSRSTVVKKHKANQWGLAAQSFALWNKQKGKVLQELVHRRAEEAAMYIKASPEPPVLVKVDIAGQVHGEDSLFKSRQINGQAITGVGFATGTVASLVPSEMLDGWKAAALELSPHFDWAKYVIAAVVVFGIAMTIYGRWKDRHEGRA